MRTVILFLSRLPFSLSSNPGLPPAKWWILLRTMIIRERGEEEEEKEEGRGEEREGWKEGRKAKEGRGKAVYKYEGGDSQLGTILSPGEH